MYSKKKPDLLIVLGDRYEIFYRVMLQQYLKYQSLIFVVEKKLRGSYDNQFRHAITKMSHFHFVTNSFYKKKREMGENSKNVLNFGSLAFSNLKKFFLKIKMS